MHALLPGSGPEEVKKQVIFLLFLTHIPRRMHPNRIKFKRCK